MIPICKYPTTIAFVDDNEDFLQSLAIDLPYDHASFKFFAHPQQALQYINGLDDSCPAIAERLLKTTEATPGNLSTPQVNLTTLCHEIYNDDRFNELSVVIVDYNMPYLNGIELLEKIENPHVIKILLTGEADEQIAVEAFNNNLIHRFIKKHQFLTHEQIHGAILDAQDQYFRNFSKFFTQALSLSPNLPSAVTTPEFEELFDGLLKEHKVCEYYLFQHTGSYLLLDSEANAHSLYVQNQDQIKDIELNIDASVPEATAQVLKAGSAILCPNADKVNQLPEAKDWANMTQPASKLDTKDHAFMYSVTDSDAGLNTQAAMPFGTFKETLNSTF